MYKVLGCFDNNGVLCIPLVKTSLTGQKIFEHIVSQVGKDMFLAFRLPAARLKRVVIASIGDHLSSDEHQDVLKADLYLDIEITSDTPKELRDKIEKDSHWRVAVMLIDQDKRSLKELRFSIRKGQDDMIEDRELKYY